jgi:hypothetical protein
MQYPLLVHIVGSSCQKCMKMSGGSFLWSILYKGELGLIHYSDCIDFSKQQLCMKLTKPRASHFLTLHHMLIIRFIWLVSLHITSTNKAAIESRHRWRQSRGRAGVPCGTHGTQGTGGRVRGRSSSIKHRLSRLAYGRHKTVIWRSNMWRFPWGYSGTIKMNGL